MKLTPLKMILDLTSLFIILDVYENQKRSIKSKLGSMFTNSSSAKTAFNN